MMKTTLADDTSLFFLKNSHRIICLAKSFAIALAALLRAA
jgi:hypothetical protein